MARPTGVSKIVVDLSKKSSIVQLLNTMTSTQQRFKRGSKTVLQHISQRIETEVLQPLLTELTTYPPERNRNEPVEWTSEKQHRYVMMLWRKKRIKLPYERTGALGANWKTEVVVNAKRLRIRIYTPSKIAKFVVGRIGLSTLRSVQRNYYEKPIQKYHRKTGWKPAYIAVQTAYKQARIIADEEIHKLIEGVS